MRKYEKEIRQLKQELAMHDALANRSHVPYEPFTDSQRLELQKKLKYFLEHDDDDFEVVNLRQVKEVLNQFRLTYRNLNAELQDQQRRIPAVTAPTTLSNTNIANSAEKNDNAKDSKAAAEEHVVGDSDGFGFGVGVVKGGAAAKAGKPKKSSSQQQAHPPVAAALPATASAIVSSTANATYLSSGVTPASRVVSMANLNSSVHDDAEKVGELG